MQKPISVKRHREVTCNFQLTSRLQNYTTRLTLGVLDNPRLALAKKQKKMTLIYFRSMYNKTIIRFGFCDIQNNRGLGKGYQPQPTALAGNPHLDRDYSGYHKNLIQ